MGSDANDLVPIVEGILFASPEPVSLAQLHRILGEDTSVTDLLDALNRLAEATNGAPRGVVLAQVAGGWQFLTRENLFPWVSRVAKVRIEERLTPAAIETLAVVAYKQPITRAELDALRGAQSGQHVRTLMDRGLVRTVGRADIPGAPFQYGTTRQFLRQFGLKSVEDLPGVEDLKRLARGEPS
jgi:segregation and condensation protein B